MFGHPILYLSKIRKLYNISFKLLETVLYSLTRIFKLLPEVLFTSIYRTIWETITGIVNDNNHVISVIDLSGFKIKMMRYYQRNKWNKKRKL